MIKTAIEAAYEAGTILRRYLGKIRHIETKQQQDMNLVTEADTASEKRIIEIIHSVYPGHGILGEEGGAKETASDYKWIIDPLDGTTNYTHELPLFSVSIAVEFRGDVICGIVYDPMRDEMFHAEKGRGAFLNNQPIHVSSVDKLERAMLVTGFPYTIRNNPDYCAERFVAFLQHAQAIRRLGSAALDCAYIACGRLDGYWEISLQPWDKASGQLLIAEAGGRVSDFQGNAHDLYAPPILGTNGLIHDRMIGILSEAKHIQILYNEG